MGNRTAAQGKQRRTAATRRPRARAAEASSGDVDDRMRALALVLPLARDRADWDLSQRDRAADTGALVSTYVHRPTARALRLDERGRVYGKDPEGVVRLFGRGGPLALHISLNMVFDGIPDRRPARIVLPRR